MIPKEAPSFLLDLLQLYWSWKAQLFLHNRPCQITVSASFDPTYPRLREPLGHVTHHNRNHLPSHYFGQFFLLMKPSASLFIFLFWFYRQSCLLWFSCWRHDVISLLMGGIRALAFLSSVPVHSYVHALSSFGLLRPRSCSGISSATSNQGPDMMRCHSRD